MKLSLVWAVIRLILVTNAFNLYHRIWNPAHLPPPFSLRGQLRTAEGPSLILVTSDGFDSLVSNSQHLDNNTLYQLALEREEDLSEADWDLSSIKACHLHGSHSDIIRVHLSSTGKPYAIDYFLYPVPRDGRCPPTKFGEQLASINTTLIIQASSPPPVPELRTPPPLSPTGEPIQPPPEKSFLQKYGMYIGLAILVFALTGGVPPEEGQDGQGRSARQNRR